jgi:hypothetical protein
MKPRNGFRAVPPEVSVDAWVGDAVVEAVDDVFLRDIRNGSADIEGIVPGYNSSNFLLY